MIECDDFPDFYVDCLNDLLDILCNDTDDHNNTTYEDCHIPSDVDCNNTDEDCNNINNDFNNMMLNSDDKSPI